MENTNDWKAVIWRKLGNVLLDFPEFAFLLKIAGGVLLLVIAYFVIRFFLLR
jgi:hypothetical protein